MAAPQPSHPSIKRVLVLRNAITGAASFSNKGVDRAIAAVTAANPSASFVERDLVKSQVPFLTEETSEGLRSGMAVADLSPAQRAAVALAEELVDEVKGADLIIIGLPRYNFGVPSTFKTYLDYLTRPKVTFQYGPNGPEGLLPNVPVWLVMSAGGIYGEDHYTEWLRIALGFMGLQRLRFLPVEGTAMRSVTDVFGPMDAGVKEGLAELA